MKYRFRPSKRLDRRKVVEIDRGNFKIGVDANLAELAIILNELGYVTWKPAKGTSNRKIDKLLREMNLKYFITSDFVDFLNIIYSSSNSNRTYFVLGIQKNHEALGLARMVDKCLTKCSSNISMSPGQAFRLTYLLQIMEAQNFRHSVGSSPHTRQLFRRR